jgi:hypothetical protein
MDPGFGKVSGENRVISQDPDTNVSRETFLVQEKGTRN